MSFVFINMLILVSLILYKRTQQCCLNKCDEERSRPSWSVVLLSPCLSPIHLQSAFISILLPKPIAVPVDGCSPGVWFCLRFLPGCSSCSWWIKARSLGIIQPSTVLTCSFCDTFWFDICKEMFKHLKHQFTAAVLCKRKCNKCIIKVSLDCWLKQSWIYEKRRLALLVFPSGVKRYRHLTKDLKNKFSFNEILWKQTQNLWVLPSSHAAPVHPLAHVHFPLVLLQVAPFWHKQRCRQSAP